MARQDTYITTASTIDGWHIDSYHGIVASHVVAGTGLFSDFAAGVADIFGGRSGSYQRQLSSLYQEVLFFFKQKTAYEVGLGIPAEPLFRSAAKLRNRL